MSQQQADVQLESVTKAYGDVVAVDDLDARGRSRRVLHDARPVGLRQDDDAAADRRLRVPDEGRVLLEGADVTRQPPYARDVNTVFQDYALFPHMTIGENVAYGMKVKRVGRTERDTRTSEALELVRLGGLEGRKPAQLSGGQRQRSRSPARSSTARRCCCSTSRSARST